MEIRKIDYINEPLVACMTCGESSASCKVDTMFEITLSQENKINLCDECLETLRLSIRNYERTAMKNM